MTVNMLVQNVCLKLATKLPEQSTGLALHKRRFWETQDKLPKQLKRNAVVLEVMLEEQKLEKKVTSSRAGRALEQAKLKEHNLRLRTDLLSRNLSLL